MRIFSDPTQAYQRPTTRRGTNFSTDIAERTIPGAFCEVVRRSPTKLQYERLESMYRNLARQRWKKMDSITREELGKSPRVPARGGTWQKICTAGGLKLS